MKTTKIPIKLEIDEEDKILAFVLTLFLENKEAKENYNYAVDWLRNYFNKL